MNSAPGLAAHHRFRSTLVALEGFLCAPPYSTPSHLLHTLLDRIDFADGGLDRELGCPAPFCRPPRPIDDVVRQLSSASRRCRRAEHLASCTSDVQTLFAGTDVAMRFWRDPQRSIASPCRPRLARLLFVLSA